MYRSLHSLTDLYDGDDDGSSPMTEYRDWTVSLPFNVPSGDSDGTMFEAIFDAAIAAAPSGAAGITGRADDAEGKVWITFTLVDTSESLAKGIADEMRERITDAVFSGDDACISAS